jgi:AraC-type DNA-binding domain-containing proteins
MQHSKPIYETLIYINENLIADISLEGLAERANFSSYHFHRVFQIYTGEAPMEYVRRLRIRSASRELLSNKSTIIEIAYKYRFESQDGFCKAFKKYYGITPGEYRKLNLRIELNRMRKSEEEKAIMYNMNIYTELVCSYDEKSEVLCTLDKVLELAEKARHSGLLSLESSIDEVQPEFFKKSIQLLIDGIEPESIKNILLNYALCGGYKGKELLMRIIILEGIIDIQQGAHPMVIREKLSSFFGEDYIGAIQKHFGLDSESQRKKIESFLFRNKDKTVTSKDTNLLEEPLARMDSRSLQRLLREVDAYTLVIAISGSSGSTQDRVLRHVSKKRTISLINEIETKELPLVSDIIESQRQILETMINLRTQGEVI